MVAYVRFGSVAAGRDSPRIFRPDNLLCWVQRPTSANSGPNVSSTLTSFYTLSLMMSEIAL
jgi:hypothetical protein